MNRKIGFQIFGEIELIEHLSANKKHYSHCISIRDPHEIHTPFIENSFSDVLELKFYDIESLELKPEYFKDKRIPLLEDVKDIFEYFSNSVKEDSFTGFTIHCWRGVSRSTAVALGLIYLITNDESEAAEYLIAIRKEALPLPRILRFWDQILGSNLVEAGLWIRFEAFKNMSKYLESINGIRAEQIDFETFKTRSKELDKKEKKFMEEFDNG